MPTKPTKRGRGRPAYQPTAANRRKVSIAAGGGMRHEDIALALGISSETLRKYFELELSVGANMRRAEVMQALFMAARKGSSSAAKAYLAVEPEFEIPSPKAADSASKQSAVMPIAPAQTLAQPLGKKAKADLDATTAQVGTDWDQILPPNSPPVH